MQQTEGGKKVGGQGVKGGRVGVFAGGRTVKKR